MKKLFSIIFLIQGVISYSQINTVPQFGIDSSKTCTGLILDPGGISNYSANAFGTFIIDPPGNSKVSLTFSQFSTQANTDFVKIYNGRGINGTLLGSYSGSSLPNSGNPIASTSGAITVFFNSNTSVNSSGFIATWSTNDTISPTAQFIATASSVAFNTPLQFVNTSVNGGTGFWDFGDGNTSTDEHPFHNYTNSGVKQVRLISSNCFGSDTSSITNITVLAAPNGSSSLDTIVLTVPCGEKDSVTFSLNNAGSGTLPFTIDFSQAQPNYLINSQWEGSGLDGFTNQNTNLYSTNIVTSASSPKGNSYLEFTGDGNSIRDGLVNQIPNSTPNEISYYVQAKASVVGNAHGYVLFKSTNGNMFYSLFHYGQLLCNFSKNGVQTLHTSNLTAGQWVHIELKEIDFTGNSFDLFLDGVKVENNVQFYQNNVTDINEVHMYHIGQGSMGLDDFRVGDDILLNPITYYPQTGVVNSNGNQTITVVGDATNLAIGEYWYDFTIQSNDTSLGGKVIPLKLIVEGQGVLDQEKLCVNLGQVYTNSTYSDSVNITNTGCDTLIFSSISKSLTHLTLSHTNLSLPPGTNTYLKLDFNSASASIFTDTVFLNGTDTSSYVCFSAIVNEAPNISINPTSLNYSLNGCDTNLIHDSILIMNSGLGILHYEIEVLASYADTSSKTFTTSGAATNHIFNNTPTAADSVEITVVLNGDFDLSSEYTSLSIEGFNYGILLDNNTVNFDTIKLKLNNSSQISNWLSDGILSLNLTNSAAVGYFASYLNSHEVFVTIYGSSQWLQTNATSSDSLLSSDSIFIPFSINTSALNDSSYTSIITVKSNDPNSPSIEIPVELNILSYPEIATSANCINFGVVEINKPYTDSLLIKNNGCADLTLSGISFNNSDFSTSLNGNQIIVPGDSLYLTVDFLPTISGNTNSFLILNNNDTNFAICLIANVTAAPIATYDHVMADICNGTIGFTDNSTNNPTQWYWNFGDGNFSIAQNPTHIYKYPGLYQVKLIATNAIGVDSLTKSINALDILYTDFHIPTTNYLNQSVQFTDSSKFATTWQWFFGDGASSALQSPVHIYTTSGTFNVSLIATSQNCSKTVNKQIEIIDNIGIYESALSKVSIYPNPVSTILTIDIGELNKQIELNVFTISGEQILKRFILNNNKNNQIDVSNWESGVYLFNLRTSHGEYFIEKIVLEH